MNHLEKYNFIKFANETLSQAQMSVNAGVLPGRPINAAPTAKGGTGLIVNSGNLALPASDGTIKGISARMQRPELYPQLEPDPNSPIHGVGRFKNPKLRQRPTPPVQQNQAPSQSQSTSTSQPPTVLSTRSTTTTQQGKPLQVAPPQNQAAAQSPQGNKIGLSDNHYDFLSKQYSNYGHGDFGALSRANQQMMYNRFANFHGGSTR